MQRTAAFVSTWQGKATVALAIIIVLLCLLAIAFALVRRGWNNFMYPKPLALAAAVSQTMPQVLQHLEATLQAKAPDVYAGLQPGLTAQQIAALEVQAGITLSAELRDLYQWRNGTAADIDLIPGHRWLPLDEAVAEYQAVRSQAQSLTGVQSMAFHTFAGHRDSWINVLPDGAGDGYFYDHQRSSHDGFFYHFAEVRY